MTLSSFWSGGDGYDTHLERLSDQFIFDPTQYTDVTAFVAGDALVVNSDDPSLSGGSDGSLARFIPRNYQFTITDAGGAQVAQFKFAGS